MSPNIIEIPVKINAEHWYDVAEAITNWPNNERTRHFHSRYVPEELHELLIQQFKIPFDIATYHKHFPLEGYKWHRDIDRQTVAICQISPDNPNVFLEYEDTDGVIKQFHYRRGQFILINAQILHRVVNQEPDENRYIVTMGWHKKPENPLYHSFERLVSQHQNGEFMYA